MHGIHRLLIAILLCMSLGSAGLFVHERNLRLDLGQRLKESEVVLEQLQSEVAALRKSEATASPKVVAREATTSASPEVVKPTASPDHSKAAGSENKDFGRGDRAFRVSARLSALEKFVSLTEEQREELRQRFADEIERGQNSLLEPPLPSEDGTAPVDTLAEVIGEQNAQHYRAQVQSAFEKAQQEAQEKEVLYYARKLALTENQEKQFRDTLGAIDLELRERSKAERANRTTRRSMSERVQAMILENRTRQALLRERLKDIFTPEQFSAFEQELAASSDEDFNVLHGSE